MGGIVRTVGKLVGGLLGTDQTAKAARKASEQRAREAQAQERLIAEQTAALQGQNEQIAMQTEQQRQANTQQLNEMKRQQELAQNQLANERELADANAAQELTNIEVGGTAAEEDPKKRTRKASTGSLSATLGIGV